VKRKLLVFLLSGCFLFLEAVNFNRYRRELINSYLKKIGPFYFQPYIILNGIGYDFNIYAQTAEEEGDWFADAGIGLRTSLIRPRFIISGSFSPSYLFYFNHKDENFWNYQGKVDSLLRLGKLHLYFGYKKSRNRIRPNFELGPRIRQRKEGYLFSAELSPGRPLSFEIAGSSERFVYEDTNYLTSIDLGARLNRRENTLRFVIKKRIFTRTRFFLETGYRQLRFKHPEITSDADQRWAAVGVQFPEIGSLIGSFKMGYKEILFSPFTTTAYTGIFGKGSVRARIGRRLQFDLFYTLDWNYSYWGWDDIYRVENYGARGFLFLTGDVKLGGGYSRGRLRYIETGRINNFQLYQAYLLFRVAERTGIGITYYYQKNYYEGFEHPDRFISYIGGVITNDF